MAHGEVLMGTKVEICKRKAPDLSYRTVTGNAFIIYAGEPTC